MWRCDRIWVSGGDRVCLIGLGERSHLGFWRRSRLLDWFGRAIVLQLSLKIFSLRLQLRSQLMSCVVGVCYPQYLGVIL
ncbi:hypothetical protein [Nostoc sp.]|uniref:hypothetical protein n=1 Tax=Nostoc sp. TaxID=1180 RepID=UPI002FF7FAC5